MFDMGIKVLDKFFLGMFGVVLALPSVAYANAGVPVIGTTAGIMIMLLIPIILIEAAILRKYLDIGYKKALKPSMCANVLSTIAALPMAFVFTLALGEATQTSEWWYYTEDFLTGFLAIALQLLVAFFVSVYLESLVVGKSFRQIEKVKIKQAVWRANGVTYGVLILFFLLPTLAMMSYRNYAFLGLILIASYVLIRFVPKKWGTVWHRRGIIAFAALALLTSLLLTNGNLMVWASRKGDAGIVKMLIKAGAVVNVEGMQFTPLMVASVNGHEEVARVLINNGADVNTKRTYHRITPLIMATTEGHMEIVKLLLAKGADVNAKTRRAESPLYLATREGHKEIVKLLLEKGADVNAKDNYGTTALKVASDIGHTDIVKMLKEAGAKE